MKNVPVKTSGCDLCLYDNMEEYERAYIKKKKTVREIVEELKQNGVQATQYNFYIHMRMHLGGEVAQIFSANSVELANELLDKKGEITKMIDTVSKKIDAFDTSINPDADPAQIRAYTGLISECRHLVESLAKLQEGNVGSGAIHAKNVTIQYNTMAAQILQDTCQKCKAKLSKTLEPFILKQSDG